ncbi:amidohydrolase [Aeromonas piscicola]|uniref:amidohydrolase n=1 Tax=Aeromonas piscicola TaxID=600645 RepID=UPI0005B372A1|nr:amidohydrolase [Aeromonas piscicola]
MKQSSCCQVAAIAAMLALSSTATAMSTSDNQLENSANTAPFSKELIAQINESVASDSARLIEIYKDLHRHPEIGYTEVRTASIVSQQLRELGFVVTEGIAKTGVVGVLKNGEGPTVWYRADMDALQVREATGLEYAANTKQKLADGREIDVMHACGHDAHVTWLLGVAKVMSSIKPMWSGTLVVYAQPAEEPGTGAQSMVDDGLWLRDFPKPNYAFGAHVVPGPTGVVASAPGVRMAGTDQLDITFYGIGGHGSTPELALDPVVMAAQAVLAYQTIISRNIDPQKPAVLTVGAIEAGRDNNVIPESAVLRLNLRWFSHEVRDLLLRRIDEVNRGIAIASGVPEDRLPTRVMKGNADAVVNDAKLMEKVTPALRQLLGEDKVISNFPSAMGSEDFAEAFKGMNVPYAYQFIGIAPPDLFAKARKEGKSFPYGLHNPDFIVDLDAIPVGVKVNAATILSVLAKAKTETE